MPLLCPAAVEHQHVCRAESVRLSQQFLTLQIDCSIHGAAIIRRNHDPVPTTTLRIPAYPAVCSA